jgi:hypothetical protein
MGRTRMGSTHAFRPRVGSASLVGPPIPCIRRVEPETPSAPTDDNEGLESEAQLKAKKADELRAAEKFMVSACACVRVCCVRACVCVSVCLCLCALPHRMGPIRSIRHTVPSYSVWCNPGVLWYALV